MTYLTQEIRELEAEKQEKMNELFPSQYNELEYLKEEIYRLKIEQGKLCEAIEEMQGRTHCKRCGEAFQELNRESNEIEGWCSYCEQVGQWND